MDNYDTVQEKKQNPGCGVKQEDWEIFVDLESTEEAHIRRAKGKASRQNLKNPHTTGRRGSARTAEMLVANDPTNPGTRTDFFIATHTRNDGSFLSAEIQQKMGQINAIVAADPNSKMKDLDHDPVAQVYGHDGRGCTRGYGDDVSKTALIAAGPYKRKAQEEKNSRIELQNELGDLRQELAEEKKARMEIQEQVNALLSRQGAFHEPNMHCSTSHNASQEV
ncbi:hypothetical protein ACHQM5_030623 [Ranunculus cassubicifolius]